MTPIQRDWHVVGWSIPGVLVGSTIGSRVGAYIPARVMEKGLGVVFGRAASHARFTRTISGSTSPGTGRPSFLRLPM